MMASSDVPNTSAKKTTWVIVGASRGIGREFVEQLLARGDRVIGTVRGDTSSYWQDRKDLCRVLNCDVADKKSIDNFVRELSAIPNLEIDHVVVNAGVLNYPNRATELSFDDFAFHLHTNTIGPIICAQRLLKSGIPVGAITFISSDSGSVQVFRDMEDGFAAYAASKAALNMAMRHMDAELKRKGGERPLILALHPGEVTTDMANVEITWEVEAEILSTEKSVKHCIEVIESKGMKDSGTFWTWENKPYPW